MVQTLQATEARRLDLVGALQTEAAARNSVLPSQPGLLELAENQPERFAGWLVSELQSGLEVAPRVVVNARKPRHGTRPAPILAIPDRVAYRAMADQVLIREAPLARSMEDYLRFVRGPVDYVMEHASGERLLRLLVEDEAVRYVVKSDLAAFYEYIDHGILGRSLMAGSGAVELVQALMEFLGELEGRSYGVPQMLGASDRLSEVYAQLLEDQLARRGHLVWRFNDDFRIGVPSFEAALEAIEALSEEARSLGLIINEQKTTTPRFATYAMATLGLDSIDDEVPEEEEDEVEAAVAEYTEAFGDPDDAVALLASAVAGEDGWDLRDVGQDQVSALRRAVWSVARAKDGRGLTSVLPLAVFVPSLTPVLCRYIERLTEDDAEEAAAVIDGVLEHVSLGGWQRLWYCRLLRTGALLSHESFGDSAGRIGFAEKCAVDVRHAATRAEAVLALASIGRRSVGTMADLLVTEPRALASWYVVAASQAAGSNRDEIVLRGIRGSSPFFALILDSMP